MLHQEVAANSWGSSINRPSGWVHLDVLLGPILLSLLPGVADIANQYASHPSPSLLPRRGSHVACPTLSTLGYFVSALFSLFLIHSSHQHALRMLLPRLDHVVSKPLLMPFVACVKLEQRITDKISRLEHFLGLHTPLFQVELIPFIGCGLCNARMLVALKLREMLLAIGAALRRHVLCFHSQPRLAMQQTEPVKQYPSLTSFLRDEGTSSMTLLVLVAHEEPRFIIRPVRTTGDFHRYGYCSREDGKRMLAPRGRLRRDDNSALPVSATHLGTACRFFLDQTPPTL